MSNCILILFLGPPEACLYLSWLARGIGMHNYRSDDSVRAVGTVTSGVYGHLQFKKPDIFVFLTAVILAATTRLRTLVFLQVAVSGWEIIALAIRVATFSLFLRSLLLSLLLNSFRFLLKPGEGGSIDAMRWPALDLPMQTGAARILLDMRILSTGIQGRVLHSAFHCADPRQHGPNVRQRWMAALRRPARH